MNEPYNIEPYTPYRTYTEIDSNSFSPKRSGTFDREPYDSSQYNSSPTGTELSCPSYVSAESSSSQENQKHLSNDVTSTPHRYQYPYIQGIMSNTYPLHPYNFSPVHPYIDGQHYEDTALPRSVTTSMMYQDGSPMNLEPGRYQR